MTPGPKGPRDPFDGPARIISEVFADADGNPVGRDDPALASIELEYELADGTVQRTYLVR